MYELGVVIFQSYLCMLYIRIDVCHLCLTSIAQFCDRHVNVENVEEMMGAREAEAAAVATDFGRAVATESGERWRQSPVAGGDRVRRGGGDRVRRGGGNRRRDGGDGW